MAVRMAWGSRVKQLGARKRAAFLDRQRTTAILAFAYSGSSRCDIEVYPTIFAVSSGVKHVFDAAFDPCVAFGKFDREIPCVVSNRKFKRFFCIDLGDFFVQMLGLVVVKVVYLGNRGVYGNDEQPSRIALGFIGARCIANDCPVKVVVFRERGIFLLVILKCVARPISSRVAGIRRKKLVAVERNLCLGLFLGLFNAQSHVFVTKYFDARMPFIVIALFRKRKFDAHESRIFYEVLD